MELVNPWTGRSACALQAALRMANDAFADKLGIGRRTVAKWHEQPDRVPRPEMQEILDTTLYQAPDAAKARFARLMEGQLGAPALTADAVEALRVAIAVVVKDSEVLLVQRRGDDGGGIAWQFPAGMVKPGVPPETVAVREALAETNVHCAVVRKIGSRLHPITHVHCDYLLCEYLAGEAENRDVVENVSVTWANRSRLTRFIPADQIFPPILDALEVPPDDRDDS